MFTHSVALNPVRSSFQGYMPTGQGLQEPRGKKEVFLFTKLTRMRKMLAETVTKDKSCLSDTRPLCCEN